MTEEEKRVKVIQHKRKMTGYFIKMLLSLIAVPVTFRLALDAEGIFFVLSFVMMFVGIIVALCFKMLHFGMLYCPLCGASFNNYSSWFTRTMPYTCPHCGEKLYY